MGIALDGKGITSLKAGDFHGLTRLEWMELDDEEPAGGDMQLSVKRAYNRLRPPGLTPGNWSVPQEVILVAAVYPWGSAAVSSIM